MASSQGSPSNAVTDISHVLESLSSLIGELDAIEINKVDEVERNENSNCASDLSLETLLAETDQFDDDEQRFLIPQQNSAVQKSPPDIFSHKSHHDHLFNSTALGHGGTTCNPVYDSPAGSASSNGIITQPNTLQSQNLASLRAQGLDNHYAVPSGTSTKGVSASQFITRQSQDTALPRKQEHDHHYSVPSGTSTKGVSSSQFSTLQSQNTALPRKQEHDHHYSVPSGTSTKGVSSSQFSTLQSQNTALPRKQEHDHHYSVPSGTRAKGINTSQPQQSLQSQNSESFRMQQRDNHYSVPQGTRAKSVSTSQSSSLQSQNSESSRMQQRDNHYSVPQGTRAKSVSTSQSSSLQSQNSESSRMQVRQRNHSVPPTRTVHKDAFKAVALSEEVHGSFKKVGEGSRVATAQKTVDLSASHPKAEPNHYIAPGELGCPRSTQVNVKPDAGMVHGSKQMKQDGYRSQDIPVNVFNEDDKPVGLLVTCSMKAREACHKLALLNKVEDDPQWVLVEHLTDLGLERYCEDHENVMAILKTWAPGSNNKLLFRKDSRKYHFFAHTSNYFPPHLLDSENSDKAITEKAQKAKTILHQKLFSTCTRVPEVEGNLHCKEFGKKSWSKKFIFLRGSGLYSSSKGKSKASKDLESYVQFDGANLYSILNPRRSHKAPTEFCFCIVPFRARELKELKCFCVDDEKTLMSWVMAVRISKFGPQLRQNYDDMLRKFAKLTKYRDQQTSASKHQNVISERENGDINDTTTKEGQVAMDFTGERGRVITDSKEIQELASTRTKVCLSRRASAQHFIPTDTAVPGHCFMSEPWYHGRITREHSLELLMAAGIQDGLFLVRESSSVAGVFVLTFCMNRRVYHCQLVQDIGEGTQTFFSLGKGPAFKTLQQLIHFYQHKPLNGVSLALRIPCPKTGYKPQVVM